MLAKGNYLILLLVLIIILLFVLDYTFNISNLMTRDFEYFDVHESFQQYSDELKRQAIVYFFYKGKISGPSYLGPLINAKSELNKEMSYIIGPPERKPEDIKPSNLLTFDELVTKINSFNSKEEFEKYIQNNIKYSNTTTKSSTGSNNTSPKTGFNPNVSCSSDNICPKEKPTCCGGFETNVCRDVRGDGCNLGEGWIREGSYIVPPSKNSECGPNKKCPEEKPICCGPDESSTYVCKEWSKGATIGEMCKGHGLSFDQGWGHIPFPTKPPTTKPPTTPPTSTDTSSKSCNGHPVCQKMNNAVAGFVYGTTTVSPSLPDTGSDTESDSDAEIQTVNLKISDELKQELKDHLVLLSTTTTSPDENGFLGNNGAPCNSNYLIDRYN